MICLDNCQTYELDNFIDGNRPINLYFYEKDVPNSHRYGTTDEEVIRALIHRLTYLNKILMGGNFRSQENSFAITKLEEALMWLEKRERG